MKEPSPEVKAAVREWVKMQQEKYGPDWKRILAEEMTRKTAPFLGALLKAMEKKNG